MLLTLALFGLLYIANVVLLESRHRVEHMLASIKSADIVMTVEGREFTDDERNLFAQNATSHFETRAINLSLSNETKSDFRVGDAHVIVADENFPTNDWLDNSNEWEARSGEIWVNAQFARALGLAIDDKIEIADEVYTFTHELIGFPEGFTSLGEGRADILLFNGPKSELSYLDADPNLTHRFFLSSQIDMEAFQAQIEKSIDTTTISVEKIGLTRSARFEKIVSAIKFSEMVASTALIVLLALLIRAMKQLNVAIDVKITSKSHPIWKILAALIATAAFVSLATIPAYFYAENLSSILALPISLLYFLAVSLIALSEVYFKSSLRRAFYRRVIQFIFILVIFLLQTRFEISTLVKFYTFVGIFITLFILWIERTNFMNLNEYLRFHYASTAFALFICSVSIGSLIEGSTRLTRSHEHVSTLTISQFGDAGLKVLPPILDEQNIAPVHTQKLLTAQIMAVNGQEVSPTYFKGDTLWITASNHPLENAKIIEGSWWSVFSYEDYIAMTSELATKLGLKVGDQITLFSRGDEIVLRLTAIFTKNDPFENAFANVMINERVLEQLSSTNYMIVNARGDKLNALVDSISKQLPEAKLSSNASDIWAEALVDKKAQSYLTEFEWILSALIVLLLVPIAAAIPKQRQPIEWGLAFNLALPFALTLIVLYFASIGLIFEIFVGQATDLHSISLNSSTWLGVGLYIAIFTMFFILSRSLWDFSDENHSLDTDFS